MDTIKTNDGNTGKYNTGMYNVGSYNVGSYNAGEYNTGNDNFGNLNAGDGNEGSVNSGDNNAGDFNTGDCNFGSFNTGSFNACNHSNGFFCTEEPKINIFNMPTDMTFKEFKKTEWYKALNAVKFPLTYWEDGTLRRRFYKNACKLWWSKLYDENKAIIQTLPNFNKDVFYDITGIRL